MDETDYRERENWLTPVKAIRKKCLDCCAGSRKLVRECHIFTCPLWPFRLGKRPETVERASTSSTNAPSIK